MRKDLASIIDHTLLNADATKDDIHKLCREAIEYEFFAVCVNSGNVTETKEALRDSHVRVVSTVDFPFGAGNLASKIAETRRAAEDGADEIDVVMPLGAFRSGKYELVVEHLSKVREVSPLGYMKVILECGLWTPKQIEHAAQLAAKSGAKFVKTSTGYLGGGAQVEHVKIMRSIVGENIGVKASGGIRTEEMADALVAAGATRIGASRSVEIVTHSSSN